MAKIPIAPGPYLVPMPTVLVGSMVEGRPNFMTAAFCSIVNIRPPVIACGLSPKHRTCRGLEETRVFSINVPTVEQVEITDHCGLVSGDNVDKSGLFDVSAGSLGAPLIAECPITAECRLLSSTPLDVDTVYLGEIVSVQADESVLTDGDLDWSKVRPLLFTFPKGNYWRFGEHVARAWSVGKGFRAPAR
jgi:flavin reductase (DIM6/NTAB) family NADH-FMN oxidoreductase RutF